MSEEIMSQRPMMQSAPTYTYEQCLDMTNKLTQSNNLEKSKIPTVYIVLVAVALLVFGLMYRYRERLGFVDEDDDFDKKKYVMYSAITSAVVCGGTYFVSKKYGYWGM